VVLVPDCFLPSNVARSTYGSLAVCGKVNNRNGGAKLWRRLAADIEEHAYAAISIEEAERVLGRDHSIVAQLRKSVGDSEPGGVIFPQVVSATSAVGIV